MGAMRLRLPRFSYANVAATLALLIAVAGTGGGQAVAAVVKKLAPNSVTSKTIKNRSIIAADVATGSIGGNEIKNGSLGGVDVADGSLGGQDIAGASVAGSRLVPNSVDSSRIANQSLTSVDIADGTISNADVGNGALGFEKLSNDAKTQLSQVWADRPINAGSVLTGYGATAYNASGATDARGVSFSFPAAAQTIRSAPVTTGDSHCTGSYVSPQAAAGYICYYLKADDGGANHVGTLEPLSYGPHGFVLKYTPVAGAGWTFAEITWAYTAPAA
ncbi:hypothetical protein [Nocardioides sp. Kera G14]|uniref:hypothetical protein n=1 Tax=Nocardioides sp. Kera G14 TaxID=2884264 RepID=UPI001D119ECA|nr:hypothetical protein [Nocardioides sp. Kera G14]UDY22348.1 hypothetical protein LH076_09665 [Nocardioides sp. Kera G14]